MQLRLTEGVTKGQDALKSLFLFGAGDDCRSRSGHLELRVNFF
jgi:hypothetical protein